MDEIAIVKRFLRATKMNNFDLLICSLKEICPMFFAYDHHNYARYVSLYYMQLLDINIMYPGAEYMLRSNGFSVGGSTFPAARKPVDQTIEQTYNRSAKTLVVSLALVVNQQHTTDGA